MKQPKLRPPTDSRATSRVDARDGEYPASCEGRLHSIIVLYIAGFVGGAMASVLGGYVAARIAKRGHLWNGALSSYLCIGSSIYALVSGAGGTIPLWQHIAFLPSSPAATREHEKFAPEMLVEIANAPPPVILDLR